MGDLLAAGISASMPQMGEPLSKYVEWQDRQGYRLALRSILSAGGTALQDKETLKRIASPKTRNEEPFSGTPEALSLQLFLGGYDARWIKQGARVALIALGCGSDSDVISWISAEVRDYFSLQNQHSPPVDFMLLIASDNEAALPPIEFVLANTRSWSYRIACLYRLPKSRVDGNFDLIESFRHWVLNATDADWSRFTDWIEWRNFASCMTVAGIRMLGCGLINCVAAPPTNHRAPLIKWALENQRINWLLTEWHWLRDRNRSEFRELTFRLVQAGIPAAADYCCEQIHNAQPEEYTHCDVVQNALRLHPKPLPKRVLDACVEVIRRPCHPANFEHRIESLRLLVEAVESDAYPKVDVVSLVLELIEQEADPDVRIAAIELAPWADPLRV